MLTESTQTGTSMDRDYQDVRHCILHERRTGVAYLHQRLLLGKNKIERILEQLERDGVVSRMGSGGAREILMAAPAPVIPDSAPQEDD